ncbi:MAG: hypothetical protein GY761_11875 [Hyphomicrobiales bacterium]|nr:hypothetical protein [Hyphomicrobiales bacterium]
MNIETETIVVISVLIGAFAVRIIYQWFTGKLRARKMEQAAAALGLKYAARGKGADAINVITGNSDDINMNAPNGIKIRISDRPIRERSGKGHRTLLDETRISLSSRFLQMPTFTITRESLFQRGLTAMFGMPGINFDSHPAFSGKYLLYCKNEEECRAFFTDAILEKFSTTRGSIVKGSGQTLLIYRFRKRIRPSNLQTALKEAFEVFDCFSVEADTQNAMQFGLR